MNPVRARPSKNPGMMLARLFGPFRNAASNLGLKRGRMRSSARCLSMLAWAAAALITMALADASPSAAAPPTVNAVDAVEPPSGPTAGGGLVSISGFPFDGATSVKFGGVEAQSFTVQEGGQSITAVAPPHAAGVVAVTVTTPGGTSPTYDCDPTASTDRHYRCDQFRYVEPRGGVWSPTGSMAAQHDLNATVTVLRGGKVLVAGGDSADASATDLFDAATGTFASCTAAAARPGCPGPMGTARADHTATLLQDGRVLVVGGDDPFTLVPTRSAELYDPATGKWTPTGLLTTARYNHTATLLPDGRVLVVGGQDQDQQSTPTAELYNPTTGMWSPTTSLGQGVQLHTATLLPSGKVLVAGGRSNTATNTQIVATSSLYDPASGVWTSCPTQAAASAGCPGPLSHRRYQHTATSLSDGKVLALGGTDADGGVRYRAVERYDPATGVWTDIDPLGEVRYGPTATLLPNGKVLAAGGSTAISGMSVASAELFDPNAGRWGYTGFMAKARSGGRAVLLPAGPRAACGTNCGKVLVVSGQSADFSTPAPELFTPAPEVNAVSPASGPESGGATVEIAGTGLASASAVSFGGVNAQSFSADEQSPDTKLRAVIPAHAAGPVEVAVVTGGGETRSAFAFVAGPVGGGGLSAGGAVTSKDTVAPSLSSVAVSRRVFAVGANSTAVSARKRRRTAVGTTFSFRLSEPAKLAIAIAKRLPGRRRGKSCVKPSAKLRKAKRCTRLSGFGTLTRVSRAGVNSVAFSGRIGRRALKPGRYQATLTATDAAGNRSGPRVVSFKVARP